MCAAKGLMVALEIVKPDGSKAPDGDKAMAILQKMLDHGLVGYMAGQDWTGDPPDPAARCD